MTTLAIIGAGVAGLGCAYFLRDKFELTLYEQNDYAGGHTHTITVDETGRAVPIDTGFMVYNEITYPNLTRLFRELNVETKPTSMSFSVQHRPSGLEYNGTSLNGLFAQRSNLYNARFWRLLVQINRFNAEAVSALDDPRFANHTVRDYVAERGYDESFLHLFLVPMSGAVWSTPPDKMLDFPAMTLLRFFHNHGFLGLRTQHPWRTLAGGAKSYVAKMSAPWRDRISLNDRAVRVTREDGQARVISASGASAIYDKVIFASHADQTLRLLADPTDLETRLLREFHYQPNTVTLHTDSGFMPKTSRAWASWNYRIERDPKGGERASTHYWMNSLQGVSRRENYFVSLNSHDQVDPSRVLRRIEFEHPVFNRGAIAAQQELPLLNRLGREQTTYFCGSYFKYGFHEDAFTSALECARAMSAEPVWA